MAITLDGTNGITSPNVSTSEGPVYDRGNIIGTVTEAAGAPTGAIIERGSNANGEFVKYADGTMICWSVLTPDWTSTAAQVFSHPSTFSATVMGGVLGMRSGANSAGTRLRSITNQGSTNSSWLIVCDGTQSNDSDAERNRISVVAHGRWF